MKVWNANVAKLVDHKMKIIFKIPANKICRRPNSLYKNVVLVKLEIRWTQK